MIQNLTVRLFQKYFHPRCCTVRYHTISLILSNEQIQWQRNSKPSQTSQLKTVLLFQVELTTVLSLIPISDNLVSMLAR